MHPLCKRKHFNTHTHTHTHSCTRSPLSTGSISTSVLTHVPPLMNTCTHSLLHAEPFEHWFYIHEWAPLIIFFGTYLGIVRNKKIPHVARYHIMMVSGRECVCEGGGGCMLGCSWGVFV